MTSSSKKSFSGLRISKEMIHYEILYCRKKVNLSKKVPFFEKNFNLLVFSENKVILSVMINYGVL